MTTFGTCKRQQTITEPKELTNLNTSLDRMKYYRLTIYWHKSSMKIRDTFLEMRSSYSLNFAVLIKVFARGRRFDSLLHWLLIKYIRQFFVQFPVLGSWISDFYFWDLIDKNCNINWTFFHVWNICSKGPLFCNDFG